MFYRDAAVLFLALVLTACSNRSVVSVSHSDAETQPEMQPEMQTRVKNIILMIGDGMGAEHRKLARLTRASESSELAMDTLSVRGEVRSASVGSAITDSAASATAMATGHKTRNGVIGLDSDLNHLSNIIEAARSNGKATGLVTTTQITHATPAAFAAHTASRKNMLEIAHQMSLANIDVMMGGGEIYFLPEGKPGCYQQAGKRQDEHDLIKMLQSSGYTYICNESELKNLDALSVERVLGLFAAQDLLRPFSPDLALMTQKSIAVLSENPQGFFLMVEGGQIDWASHDNEAEKVVESLRGFDKAVKVARDFALSSNDTLLIVTADHETGGLQINSQGGDIGPFLDYKGEFFFLNWATSRHTGVKVPLTASGPMSSLLRGEIDNTDIYHIMFKAINYVQ